MRSRLRRAANSGIVSQQLRRHIPSLRCRGQPIKYFKMPIIMLHSDNYDARVVAAPQYNVRVLVPEPPVALLITADNIYKGLRSPRVHLSNQKMDKIDHM